MLDKYTDEFREPELRCQMKWGQPILILGIDVCTMREKYTSDIYTSCS